MALGDSFEEEYVCFVVEWSDGERFYLTGRDNGGQRRPILSKYTDFHTTRHFEQAGFVRKDLTDDIVQIFNKARKEYSDSIVFVMDTTVKVEFKPIDLNEGEYLDVRRKHAIAKLTPDDIEALNLEGFLVYDKLRHHNLEGLDRFDD